MPAAVATISTALSAFSEGVLLAISVYYAVSPPRKHNNEHL